MLATAVVAYIFAYLAMQIETGGREEEVNIRAAILSYANLFFSYGTILTTFYLGIQTTNYSGFSIIPGEGALLVGITNVFAILIIALFFFVTWDFYLKITKEEKGEPE